MVRASETARLILGNGKAVITSVQSPPLREMDVGEWEGLTGVQIDSQYPGAREIRDTDPVSYTPPGGESVVEAQKRVDLFIASVKQAHPEGDVLIVAHRSILGLLTTRLLDIRVKHYRRFLMEPSAVSKISPSGPAYRLELFDDQWHNRVKASKQLQAISFG